jgi:hypothetical protein
VVSAIDRDPIVEMGFGQAAAAEWPVGFDLFQGRGDSLDGGSEPMQHRQAPSALQMINLQ